MHIDGHSPELRDEGLAAADNTEVGVAGFVPCAVSKGASPIRHEGDQEDEENPRGQPASVM